MPSGELDKMKAYIDQIISISGFQPQILLIYYYALAGKFLEAYKIISEQSFQEQFENDQLIFTPNTSVTYVCAFVLYKSNKIKEAHEYCNKQIKLSMEGIRLKRDYATGYRGGFAYYAMAAAYVILDEKEKAYEILHDMEQNAFSGWYTKLIQIDPIFESFWEDDEFKAIIQRQEKKYADIRAEIDRLEEEGLI